MSKKLSKSYDEIASFVGYPCIFSKTPEDAAENLVRLITNGQLDSLQAPNFWILNFQTILDGNYDLSEFNKFGAAFSETEWRKILLKVISKVKDLNLTNQSNENS